MSDTKRYLLVWLAASFIGINGGAVAWVVADACMSLQGAPRTFALAVVFVIASLIVTVPVGRFLARLVSKQLN